MLFNVSISNIWKIEQLLIMKYDQLQQNPTVFGISFSEAKLSTFTVLNDHQKSKTNNQPK
jgi:hypothetical protein